MSLRVTTGRFFGLLLLYGVTGCAGYAGEVAKLKSALYAGQQTAALEAANGAMEVPSADHYPVKVGRNTPLLLMERGMIKQAMGRYQPSANDLNLAFNHLELLDVRNKGVQEISRWVFSGNSGPYRALPHEKLLLSAMNMINYLAEGNLEDARVEARRYRLTADTLRDRNGDGLKSRLGDYLAGFSFERSGRPEQALQFYADAFEQARSPSLLRLIPKVAACTTFRNDTIDKFLGELTGMPPCHPPVDTGTLLVVSSVGTAPFRVAERLPVGAAVVLAAAYLSPEQTMQANQLAVKGLLKWVNFADLRQNPLVYDRVAVSVDGRRVESELAEDVSDLVTYDFEAVKGKLVAAAIVRMLTRAVAGEVTDQVVSNRNGNAGLGLLAQVLVEGAMTVSDTPDTRSWVSLPAAVFITRVELPAGDHRVTLAFNGPGGHKTVTRKINVLPGGFAALPVHMLR